MSSTNIPANAPVISESINAVENNTNVTEQTKVFSHLLQKIGGP